MTRIKKNAKVLHYPRIDTVIMVEKEIQKSSNYPTKNQLWRSLPKQVQYQTLTFIVNYLEELGKIIIKDKQIIWVWDPKGVKEMLAKPHLRVR
jgi:hypothetical protein